MEAASVESNKRKRPAVQRERLVIFFFPPVYAKPQDAPLKGGRPFLMSFLVNTFRKSWDFVPG